MNAEQLNKTDENTFKINNFLDFSFGDENNENKSDIDMIDFEDSNIKNQENQQKYINNSEKEKKEKKQINNFFKYGFIFEENEANNLYKNTTFLVSKKRKRKNELNHVDEEGNILKQLQTKKNKTYNSQMNNSHKDFIFYENKFYNQDNMEIKEDSTEIDIDENSNTINDNFNINVDIVINKLKNFNINKNFGHK